MNTAKKFSVESMSNGWLLVWSDPSIDEDFGSRLSQQWPQPKRPKSAGGIVFTDRKKLLKHIEGLV